MEKGSLFLHELLPFDCPVDTRNKSDHPLPALAFPTFPLPRCSPGWTRTLPVLAFQFLGLKVVPPGPTAPAFNPEKTIPSWKEGLPIISITFAPDPLNYPRTTQAEENVNQSS